MPEDRIAKQDLEVKDQQGITRVVAKGDVIPEGWEVPKSQSKAKRSAAAEDKARKGSASK